MNTLYLLKLKLFTPQLLQCQGVSANVHIAALLDLLDVILHDALVKVWFEKYDV